MRRLIAAIATVLVLPQAAAQECIWPQPEPLPSIPPPVADGIAAAKPNELPVEVTSGGGGEVTREGDLSLTGGVVVRQGDRRLTAQSATYDATEQSFKVDGDVEFVSPELRLKGLTGAWDMQGAGQFTSAEFELPAQQARGSAAELEVKRTGELALSGVSFTACPAGNDDWILRASSIDIDQRAQQGKGRGVRIELKGIPILYAPLITFPVGDARKSGFLFPSFGNSNKSGFELGVPYYFNLAPNYDLTLTPFLLSRRGIGLDAGFRYLTARSRGQIDTRYLPSDDLAARDRRLSTITHVTDLSERLRFDASLADASDSRYFEDFGLGPDGTSVTFLDRYLHLAWLGRGWRLDGRVHDFQTIDLTVDPLSRPYSRLPQLQFSGTWPGSGGNLSTSFDAEATWFERDQGTTGLRLDLAPRIAWALKHPGWYVEPSASWRLTAYRLSDAAPGADDSPTREAPVLSLDAGMQFERVAGARDHLVHTLEPRLRYTYIPFRDQSDLPVFDTALPNLNLVQLFRTNRYVGADRLGDANELAAGLTTRLFNAESGKQFLTATVGQRFYFESPRVVLPGEIPESRNASNMVGEIELTAWRNWSARLALEWDNEQSNTVLGQAGLQYRPRPDAVINLGYRYREGVLEQWDGSFAWRLSPSWQVFARQVYSTKDDKSIDRFAGFEYGSCCWRVRLIGRRYVSNRTGESDNSVMLQLELKGLSSVGTTNDAFLERGIRGYSPGLANTLP